MAELKTQVNDASVTQFLKSIKDKAKHKDTSIVFRMLRDATGAKPRMWGTTIIGFGTYHYVGRSGREGDWFLTGVSPRKQAITLYMMGGWQHNRVLLKKLGKHTLGKGCLYIRRLDDVDVTVLKRLINDALKRTKRIARTNRMRVA